MNSSVGVSGHDVATGERLWHVEEANRFPIPIAALSRRPHLHEPRLSKQPIHGDSARRARGTVAASHVAWKVSSGAPYISSLVYYDGLIYMVGDVGVLTVSRRQDGRARLPGADRRRLQASPVAADGKVYLVSEDGETIVLAAGRTPRVLARNRLDARQLASPAIAGGRLFIRSDDALYAIGK